MRSYTISAVAVGLIAATTSFANALEVARRDIEVVEYNIESQYTKFSVPLEATQSADLVFRLQPVAPRSRPDCHEALDILVSGQQADLCFQTVEAKIIGSESSATFITAHSNLLLDVSDTAENSHLVNVTVDGYALGQPQRNNGRHPALTEQIDIRVNIVSVDDLANPPATGFLAHFAFHSLETLKLTPGGGIIDVADFPKSFSTPSSPKMNMTEFVEDISDIEDELASLRLLEVEAETLSAEIAARKQAVNRRIKQQTAKIPLKHLIEQCDGIVCAAKAIAERICIKMSIKLTSQPAYNQINAHSQSIVGASGDSTGPQQTARNCTKSNMLGYGTLDSQTHSGKAQGAAIPAIVTQNGTTEGGLNFINHIPPQSTLMRALEVIAAVLGLTALYAFVRRKCMSMRTRVERAADKEERRNARAYRRAARKASFRRRWNSVIDALSCFRVSEEPRVEDYEEKRALILQDAFLEQNLDQAEKGEIMEAEIRELRHAHEIVSSLVRVGENRYDLHRPFNDPPPPLVPLPYTPATRSRASTATLPSYTSESLPDYTSTPDSSEENSTTTDGFVDYHPSNSDEDGRYTPTAPPSLTGTSSSSMTRYTPVSSVVGISPRCSEETLRTRQSKDSRD